MPSQSEQSSPTSCPVPRPAGAIHHFMISADADASTRKLLESLYRQQGKRPVNYFEFVIDPESFGNTVENMFHVSFLVKQRVVTLSVDDAEGLPFLEPVRG